MALIDPVSKQADCPKPLLLCFSHLRWDFVFQRPQHLMTRFTQLYRVIVWEEPLVQGAEAPRLEVKARADVTIVTPILPDSLDADGREAALRSLLDRCIADEGPIKVR